MDALFLKIFNLSIIAGWITLAIVVLRPLLKKAPKALTVALWALVAIRLLVPLSVESEISVIPSTQTVPPEIVYVEEPQIHSGIHVANTLINPVIEETMAPKPEASVNPMQIAVTVASTVWVVGMIAMAVYALLSYLRIRLKVRASIPLQKRIRICDNINSPFILGVFRPRIYLPSNLTEEQKHHVIAHEEAHLKRKDHWWKPLGFALLTVYWFHPLLWVAYILLCRDIELACDERVIKNMEQGEKASYSNALLSCSMPRRMISACPLAFGEVGVKKRIKEILHYKKPAFWLTILAIVICIVCTGCLLTDPIKEKAEESETVLQNYEGVSFTMEFIQKAEFDQTLFYVLWHNETDQEITYGETFTIEYKSGEKWVTVVLAKKQKSTSSYYSFNHDTKGSLYIAEKLDLSECGLYRLIVPFSVKDGDEWITYQAWKEFNVTSMPNVDVDALRKECPQYFGLDASNGLDVYVWQFAKHSYSFGLLPHSDQERNWLDHDLRSFKSVSKEEMRAILSTYDIKESDIQIHAWGNPVSSYLGDWQLRGEGESLEEKEQAYEESIHRMLFGTWPSISQE